MPRQARTTSAIINQQSIKGRRDRNIETLNNQQSIISHQSSSNICYGSGVPVPLTPFEDLKNVFSKEKRLALSHYKIKKLLKEKGISFCKTPQRVIFTVDECQRIIEDWNESKGKDFAQKIVSKYNYDFESIDEGTGTIKGIKNHRDNRYYGQSCLMHILSLIKNRKPLLYRIAI